MEHYAIEEQLKGCRRISLNSHKATIKIVRWSPDGNILASGGRDKLLNIYRVKESDIVSDPQNTTQGHTGELEHICWNWDNPNLLSTAASDRLLKIWDIRYVEPIANIKLKNELSGMSWSNSGSVIALADKGEYVSFVDIRNGWKIANDQKFPFEIRGLAWNKESDFLHLITVDGKMHVYSYPQFQNLMTSDVSGSQCSFIRFDQSGKYFAVGSNDAVNSIYDYENIACITAIDRLESPILSAAFTFDSRYIATAGVDDATIDLADVLTGQLILPIDLGTPCFSLDFHPKDYFLAYSINEHEHYRDVGTIKIMGFPERRTKHYG